MSRRARSSSAGPPPVGGLVFQALADATRREILQLLVVGSRPLTINQIAEHFPATRQAVTRHLKLLAEARLVEIHPKGRERLCRPNLEPMQELGRWVGYYERFWEGRLRELGRVLDEG